MGCVISKKNGALRIWPSKSVNNYRYWLPLNELKSKFNRLQDSGLKHYLYAFDFDHTILDGSSNSAVTDLLLNPIPQELSKVFNGTNWTEFSDMVMKYIATTGIKPQQIYKKIQQLKLLPGMEPLLQRIRLARETNIGSQLIIVSDANNFFIEAALSALHPPIQPDKVISNYGVVSKEGLDDPTEHYLQIKPYETQNSCPFCPINLCKGAALEKHIVAEGPFEQIYYAGDGSNDVCPAMRLREKDILFVREGFALETLIRAGQTRKKVPIRIRAKIIYFRDATILQQIMQY